MFDNKLQHLGMLIREPFGYLLMLLLAHTAWTDRGSERENGVTSQVVRCNSGQGSYTIRQPLQVGDTGEGIHDCSLAISFEASGHFPHLQEKAVSSMLSVLQSLN